MSLKSSWTVVLMFSLALVGCGESGPAGRELVARIQVKYSSLIPRHSCFSAELRVFSLCRAALNTGREERPRRTRLSRSRRGSIR